MPIGLVLFALLFVFVMLRRGRRSSDDSHEFPYEGLYSKDKSESLNLYGRHTENHLYPDRGEDSPMHADHRSQAS
jgi:hypothetical protein